MNVEASVWVEVPFDVQKDHDGLRVDSYLASRLHRYSRNQVQRLIASGRVSLRGRLVKAATRVASGETVLIRYPRHQELPCPHTELPAVYEDECLLIINKPAPLLCHPTDRVQNNTVTSILKRQFPGLKLHLAHRLDRETSGALLLAKDPRSAQRLAGHFFSRRVKKEYLALVFGRISWRRKIVDAPLGRENLEIKVRQKVGTGAAATTEFERLASGASVSLVRALPRTGRLHQIRVHLAHLGHPVLGDKLYTGKGELYMKAVRKTLTAQDLEKLGAQRQMLHAHRLSLPHPGSGHELSVTAPPPEDFCRVLENAGLTWP
ncbi:MAG TPA: RluA family pseudouridine synthase [Elusimicrobia bacterium]|nr:RluA family pseudouridine synthase [Elusimicrobiota bacterium]HBT60268.1 RluA family pseudouridine synthase [Elusimicrobiota bacterium]